MSGQTPKSNAGCWRTWADGTAEARLVRRKRSHQRTGRSQRPTSRPDRPTGYRAFKRGTPQRERLDKRIASLTERQADLSATPNEPAGRRYEPTGELFADWWADQDIEAKNIWLRQMNFRVVWKSHTKGSRTIVDEFELDGDLKNEPGRRSAIRRVR
ncbi:hypothetical protein ACFOJ6_19945 [Gordonia humi]|uniref:hypothetical protein n=1 Tax=Gordonia humi TaxID=686429 RepID=UPI00361416CD